MLRSIHQNPSPFIVNLSDFLLENKQDADDIAQLMNVSLDEADKGAFRRIFQNVTFHITSKDTRMKALVESYGRAYKKLHSVNADRFYYAEKFMHEILDNYALPDLINPQTWLIKDELSKVLGYTDENYHKKNQDDKIQITTYIIDAYFFYFISAIFLEFVGSQKANKDIEPINFDDFQREIINAENLKGMIQLQIYLKKDATSNFSGFTFAHKLILDLVDTHRLEQHHDFFTSTSHHTLMNELLKLHPKVGEKILECMGCYRMLGSRYASVAEALIFNRNDTPESKSPSSKKF